MNALNIGQVHTLVDCLKRIILWGSEHWIGIGTNENAMLTDNVLLCAISYGRQNQVSISGVKKTVEMVFLVYCQNLSKSIRKQVKVIGANQFYFLWKPCESTNFVCNVRTQPVVLKEGQSSGPAFCDRIIEKRL